MLVETMGDLVRLPSPPPALAGFWRRTAAWFVDAVILGAPVLFVGFFLFGLFMSFHLWGRLIGFVLAATYFALFNSKIGRGQTLGNRLLGIAVVNAQGHPVALARSLWRYVVLAGPHYLAFTSAMAFSTWTSGVVGFLLFCWGFLIIYLYVFNRRTRQSLHDLAAGTYVVRTPQASALVVPPIWRGHLVIATLLILIFLGLILAGFSLITSGVFTGQETVRNALLATPEVESASVFKGKTRFMGAQGARTLSNYTVTVSVNRLSVDASQEQVKVAALVLARDPGASDVDNLSVSVSYGYDFGVASWHNSKTETHSPADWKQKLKGTPAT